VRTDRPTVELHGTRRRHIPLAKMRAKTNRTAASRHPTGVRFANAPSGPLAVPRLMPGSGHQRKSRACDADVNDPRQTRTKVGRDVI
jgi:hypothetical protein